jgi:LysM repeat protein
MKQKWFILLTVFAITVSVLGASANIARAQTTTTSSTVTYISYTVQPGDTLAKIAQKYCTTWQEIYNINRQTIGDNPNVIVAGTVLIVPAYCNSGTTPPAGTVIDKGPMTHATGYYYPPYYTVAWGDTLAQIGYRFGVPWQDIAKANGITGTTIYPGQVLYIPGSVPGTIPPTNTGTIQRVNFVPGATSATLVGTIYNGAPTSYILRASAGQTMTVSTYSHGEALVISVDNTTGDLLPITGVNSQTVNTVYATLPASGDYIVTIRPVTTPESPELRFDITFAIP